MARDSSIKNNPLSIERINGWFGSWSLQQFTNLENTSANKCQERERCTSESTRLCEIKTFRRSRGTSIISVMSYPLTSLKMSCPKRFLGRHSDVSRLPLERDLNSSACSAMLHRDKYLIVMLVNLSRFWSKPNWSASSRLWSGFSIDSVSSIHRISTVRTSRQREKKQLRALCCVVGL
jgi:hypothetical protein